MTVEFNHDEVMKMFKAKRKKFLTMTGHQGVNIAAAQIGEDGEQHWDTGLSANSKSFNFYDDYTIRINAGTNYDVYLERRYGIMVRMADILIPYMAKYEEEVFGG